MGMRRPPRFFAMTSRTWIVPDTRPCALWRRHPRCVRVTTKACDGWGCLRALLLAQRDPREALGVAGLAPVLVGAHHRQHARGDGGIGGIGRAELGRAVVSALDVFVVNVLPRGPSTDWVPTKLVTIKGAEM